MNSLRKWRFSLFILLIMIIYIILWWKDYINIMPLINQEDFSIHFNIITISSIFGSFLFGALSLMIGLNSSIFIRDMERAGYMNDIYINLYSGISIAFVNIILATCIVFFKIPNLSFQKIIAYLELLTLILAIIIFIKAFKDTYFIIREMRKRMKYSKEQQESIAQSLKILKKTTHSK